MKGQKTVNNTKDGILIGPKANYPLDKTIHHLFEEQAKKTPNNTAAIFEDKKLTYKELNEKSNQLANYLIKQGIKTEDLVAICVNRS